MSENERSMRPVTPVEMALTKEASRDAVTAARLALVKRAMNSNMRFDVMVVCGMAVAIEVIEAAYQALQEAWTNEPDNRFYHPNEWIAMQKPIRETWEEMHGVVHEILNKIDKLAISVAAPPTNPDLPPGERPLQ